MRKLTTLAIVLAVSLFSGAAWAQDHAEHTDLGTTIDALAQTYADGWKAGDAAVCASIYAEDADLVDLAGQSFSGRAAIQGSIAETLGQYPGTTISIARTSIHVVSPDLVVSDGTWEVHGSKAEGAPTKGLYTIIAKKSGDQWLLVSNQSSVPPPAPND